MNNAFTILLVVVSSSLAVGQLLTPTFSDEAEVPKNEFLAEVITKADNKIVFLTESFDQGERKNFVCTYEKNKSLKRHELAMPLKNAFGYNFFTLDNKMYRWYMSKHKKSKSILRSIVQFDNEGKAIEATPMQKIPYIQYEDQPTQSIYYSPDSSKVLAVEVVDNNHKKDPVRISLAVLEKNLAVSHERVFQGKEKSQLSTDHCAARITNSGEAYLLQKVIPGGKHQKMVNNKIIPNYYYELIRVLADGSTKAYRIKDLKDFSNIQNLFVTSDDKPMIITAINESSKESSALIGFYVHAYNSENDSFETNRVAFRNKLKKWGVTKDMDYKKLFSYFDLHKEYLIDKDRIHVLFERSYFNMKGKGRKGAFAVNVKKTAIVFSIANDGEVLENMYVPKVHDSKIRESSSKLFLNDDKVYLAYMLNEKHRNGDLSDLLFFEGGLDNFGAASTILCLATKDDNKIKKWDIKNSQDLFLYSKLLHNGFEKMYIPFVDYSLPKKASLGLMTIKFPSLN